MNIVTAVGEDDIEKCLQIARELPEWFNEAGLRAMERDLMGETTFIAIEGEEVFGFITIKPLNGKALEILWMAVGREHRGKGIGTEMLRFVEGWARERGFELLVVKSSGDLTYKPYDETRRFYEWNGFVRIALIDPYPQWGEPALIYAKCLKRKQAERRNRAVM
ncbi:GNAT family N-acetyltransferase [Thermococcus indicus]|uniref:GNAT family N-acetyltransferase n=1 Tax=Thermococcus indicus TaxID=2586643 RepID=A0A4Y5SNJ6_9EURY|nr:GNAT family N-acetyltransferase [Thermococcus indicus]